MFCYTSPFFAPLHHVVCFWMDLEKIGPYLIIFEGPCVDHHQSHIQFREINNETTSFVEKEINQKENMKRNEKSMNSTMITIQANQSFFLG